MTAEAAAAAYHLDMQINDALVDLAARLRADLVATSDPDDPPTPAMIELNVDAVLRLERAALGAWRRRQVLA